VEIILMPAQETYAAPPKSFTLAPPAGFKIFRPVTIRLSDAFPVIEILGTSREKDVSLMFDALPSRDLADIMGGSVTIGELAATITLFGAGGYRSARNVAIGKAHGFIEKTA
jgi:hypothetical protein